jgi:hypothetical protein
MTGDRIKDEAERLVAAAIAAVSMASRGLGGVTEMATGSPECCVCPVCRVIAALREPRAEVAEKLVAGVSDIAVGVAALLRNLSQARGPSSAQAPPDEAAAEGDEFWESLRRKATDAARAAAGHATTAATAAASAASAAAGAARSTVDGRFGSGPRSAGAGDPWRAATTASDFVEYNDDEQDTVTAEPGPVAAKPAARPPMAKKAVKKAAPGAAAEQIPQKRSAAAEEKAPQKMAKKATRKVAPPTEGLA